MNLLDSVARFALRLGLGRNALAGAEFVSVIVAAAAFARGAGRWGGALLIVAGGLELIYRRLARLPGRVTPGAGLYEALLERAGEAVLCGGIALFFLRGGIAAEHVTLAVMITMTALGLVLLAAYARARAEGLGVEAGVGIPLGAARLLFLGVIPLVLGTGARGELLLWMTAGFAVACSVTLLARAVHVARGGRPSAGGKARPRDTLPGHGALRKGN